MRQVRPVTFLSNQILSRPTNQHRRCRPTSEQYKFLVRREIWQLISILKPRFEGEKIWFLRGNQSVKMKKILHDDQYSGYSEKNYHGVQFYVQAESPSLSSAQFLHRCGWHSVVNNFFLLFRAPTIDKFCRYFWTWSKTNFASALGKQNRKIL